MATLDEIHALAVGMPLLRQRFAAARLKAAWDILNEDAGTTNHAERLVWANAVLGAYDGTPFVEVEYRRFLSNSTIQTTGNASSDNDVQFVVNSMSDAFALAFAAALAP